MDKYFSHIESLVFFEGKAEIPGLGCFMSKCIPTKVDKLSNKIIPAHSIVKFKSGNPTSDGSLEKRLIDIDKVSCEEAEIRIKKFVYNLKKELKYGKKKLEIGSIGFLYSNIIGKVKFKYNGINLNADTIGMKPINFYENQSITNKKRVNKRLIAILIISVFVLIYLIIYLTKEDKTYQEVIKSDKSEFINYDSFKDFMQRR